MKTKLDPDVFVRAAESAIEYGGGFQYALGVYSKLIDRVLGIDGDPWIGARGYIDMEAKAIGFLLCAEIVKDMNRKARK